MTSIHDQLQQVARSVFQEPALQITDGMTAGDVERWDSLSHIQFIVEVEKRFGVKFKNSQIARLQNIGDLKALVAKHCPQLAAAA